MKKPAGIAPVLWIPFGLLLGVIIGSILGNVGYGVAFGLVAGGALAAMLTRQQSNDGDRNGGQPE